MVNFIHQRNVLHSHSHPSPRVQVSKSVIRVVKVVRYCRCRPSAVQHGRHGAEDSVDRWPRAARFGIARRPRGRFGLGVRVALARCLVVVTCDQYSSFFPLPLGAMGTLLADSYHRAGK
jgi:hypothetical protein